MDFIFNAFGEGQQSSAASNTASTQSMASKASSKSAEQMTRAEKKEQILDRASSNNVIKEQQRQTFKEKTMNDAIGETNIGRAMGSTLISGSPTGVALTVAKNLSSMIDSQASVNKINNALTIANMTLGLGADIAGAIVGGPIGWIQLAIDTINNATQMALRNIEWNLQQAENDLAEQNAFNRLGKVVTSGGRTIRGGN